MKRYLLLFILLIPLASAQDWVYDSDKVEMELDITSGIIILPKETSYATEYVLADLLFYPRDTRQQEVKSITTEPAYEDKTDYLRFQWDGPEETNLLFSLESTVINNNELKKVTSKTPFPVTYPAEYSIYTLNGEIIDSNDVNIIQQASKLAQGEDDAYKAAFKIASWIKTNIEYDLNTLTADISQKASWVLKNKFGVCDELTSLFIAMVRSVGIPARYVSGYAYTNWNELNDWGPHAWAEIYLPGEGWIPFDIAYGQLGFIDASHITLKISSDADSTATKYEWRGKNVDLETKKLNVNIKKTKQTGKISDLISINANVKKEEIGFGSYNLIEAEVTNLMNYYVPTELYIAKTPEISIVGQETIPLLLEPGETRKVYWKLYLTPSLKKDYTYTFPTEIYTVRNVSSKTEFKAVSNGVIHTESDIEQFIEQDTKTSAAKLNIGCKPSKERIYIDESLTLACTMTNIGDTTLNNFRFCLLGACDRGNLNIDQDFGVDLTYTPGTIGKKELAILAPDLNAADYVNIEVMDYPKIEITNIEAPKSVKFEDVFDFIFLLDKVSTSGAKNVKITLYRNDGKDSWNMETFTTDRRFVIETEGRGLYEGGNKFRIEVTYEDELGNEYKATESAMITLTDVTLWQKVQILAYKLTAKIEKLFN